MVLRELVDSIIEMPQLFGDIAAHDPISAVLLAVGALLVGGSLGLFGYLVTGAALELVLPDSIGTSHP